MSEQRVNAAIGERVRRHRQARGMSRAILAQALGVSPQQIQKYENGGNRIPAARLAVIAEILDRQVQDFYSDEEGPVFSGEDAARMTRRRMIARTVERLETMPDDMRSQILALIRSASPEEAHGSGR